MATRRGAIRRLNKAPSSPTPRAPPKARAKVTEEVTELHRHMMAGAAYSKSADFADLQVPASALYRLASDSTLEDNPDDPRRVADWGTSSHDRLLRSLIHHLAEAGDFECVWQLRGIGDVPACGLGSWKKGDQVVSKVLIVYCSMSGNTKAAAEAVAKGAKAAGAQVTIKESTAAQSSDLLECDAVALGSYVECRQAAQTSHGTSRHSKDQFSDGYFGVPLLVKLNFDHSIFICPAEIVPRGAQRPLFPGRDQARLRSDLSL